jgi:NADH-quinone oxidoreductase subunit J
LHEILFFLFSGVAVVSALLMILHRNPVYSAIFLIVTLFALAGFYVMLNAPFVASVHLIVYAGAIMVLFLFVIMLLNLQKDAPREGGKLLRRIAGATLTIALLAELGALLVYSFSGRQNLLATPASAGVGLSAPAATVDGGEVLVGSTRAIGAELFTKYLLPFEIASVVLLVAMIGAVIIGKRKLK